MSPAHGCHTDEYEGFPVPPCQQWALRDGTGPVNPHYASPLFNFPWFIGGQKFLDHVIYCEFKLHGKGLGATVYPHVVDNNVKGAPIL